jgi:hypothetical protein
MPTKGVPTWCSTAPTATTATCCCADEPNATASSSATTLPPAAIASTRCSGKDKERPEEEGEGGGERVKGNDDGVGREGMCGKCRVLLGGGCGGRLVAARSSVF